MEAQFLVTARGTSSVRASDIFALLHHHEIRCSVDSFSGSAWTAKLGDPSKGCVAEQGGFRTIDDAANWRLDEARRRYPDAMPGGHQNPDTMDDSSRPSDVPVERGCERRVIGGRFT